MVHHLHLAYSLPLPSKPATMDAIMELDPCVAVQETKAQRMHSEKC